MIRSIIHFVFRNFARHFSFSLITLGSLVLGITTALLMFLWIKYEVTYNKSMIDNDRVFTLMTSYKIEGEIQTDEGTGFPLIDFLSHEVPEIEAVSRIYDSQLILSNGNKSIGKTGIYADTSFFRVHLPVYLSGKGNQVLPNNRSIVISQLLANELFGTDNVIGKSILVDHKDEYLISGVFAPFPDDSSFKRLHFVLPFAARPAGADYWKTDYHIKLYTASSHEAVEKKIDQKVAQLSPDDIGSVKSLLFAMEDWRLHWEFKNGKSSGGRILYVITFSITSLFVLVMSCVNYMNIATARATKRMREIGVRKMTGATQRVLISQFMTESLIITSVAALVSILLANLLLPLFNELVGQRLVFSFSDPVLIAGLLCITLFTGLLAGSYPALVLSSYKPATVLKGNLYTSTSGAGFRNGLVVFQFALSVVMIFCAMVMWKQIDFLLKRDLGYDKYRIINVWLGRSSGYSFDNIHSMITSHSAIESAGFSGASPMEINGFAECNVVNAPFSSPLPFYGVNIDQHFLQTLKFELVAGRNFSRASDSSNFIITQTAANLLGFKSPVGQRITYNMFGNQEGEVIGVIKDFQNDDIHVPVKPVVFVFGKPPEIANLFVRYQEGRLEEALAHVRTVFEKIQPGIPLNYSLLDSDYETQLYRETLLGKISISFTVVAVAIACLGLFGLVLFNTQRRTKEIGIRKVLGATEHQIVLMLCRNVVPFVLYSLLIAFPIAYYIMQNFLEDFPTRISISPNLFLMVAGLISLMVLLTISYLSLKAARQNVVESLKTE